MNAGYENRRENLWKEFEAGVKGRHHSFFVQQGKEQITGKVATFPAPEYTIKIPVNKVLTLLENKLKYKKKWPDYEIYNFGVLHNYLQQCVDGGYQMCIISAKEFAMIQKGK